MTNKHSYKQTTQPINKWVLMAVWSLVSCAAFAQNCLPTTFNFTPTTKNRTIEWTKFPEFSLPFQIIYGGPRVDDARKTPLNYGFSHLSLSHPADIRNSKNIANIYYGVAYLDGKQPWETVRSPWNNDIQAYRNKWREFAGALDADLVIMDIERQWYSANEILQLKNHATTPNEYKSLDNQSFINKYRADIQQIYTQPIKFFKENYKAATLTKFGSYADSPLYPSIVSISSNSWQKWLTDKTLLNNIVYDFSKNQVGGEFYNQLDFISPSAYYYFEYPNLLAGDYLPYLLFMVEANKALTNKPIIPFVWLRYDAPDRNYHEKFISSFMAEATAIFPLMAGANGICLWDNATIFWRDESFSAYEYFTYGLYKISLFKDMFDGKQTYVMPTPANEYPDKRTPVWRGVANGNYLLVAAQNPYAKSENEQTTFEVSYKNWKQTITLKGYEVFLCKFDLNLLSTENQEVITDLKIFPNPVSDKISVEFSATQRKNASLEIVDLQGKVIRKENIEVNQGKNYKELSISELDNGIFLLKIENLPAQKIFIQH